MPESSIVVRPEPMDGASYTHSSRLQAAGLRAAIALFEQAAGEVVLPKQPQPIAIADYGAATGHNSLLPISAAIAALRKRTAPEHPILVAHTDVAENDFSVLFRTLAEDPDSYLRKDTATYASAVGRSFFKQILPSNSISLGWSSWAVHWLSRVPAPVEDHLHAAYTRDERLYAAYTKQAAEDWHEFIAFRGRELSPHGRLVVLTTALNSSGEFGYRPILDAMFEVLSELVDDGPVTSDELGRMSIPVVGRTEKDFRAPFAPKGRFEGLTIEHLEVFEGEDRYWAQYQTDKNAAAFGGRWASFARAAVFPALIAALDGVPGDEHAIEFADQLENGVARRLAAAPEHIKIPLAKVVLTKSGRSR
jgi:hypothetical protein